MIFESGSNKDMDVMIGVYAPEDLRIKRAMMRSNLNKEQVLAIVAKQMKHRVDATTEPDVKPILRPLKTGASSSKMVEEATTE